MDKKFLVFFQTMRNLVGYEKHKGMLEEIGRICRDMLFDLECERAVDLRQFRAQLKNEVMIEDIDDVYECLTEIDRFVNSVEDVIE